VKCVGSKLGFGDENTKFDLWLDSPTSVGYDPFFKTMSEVGYFSLAGHIS
jgi:hypothetical protein